MYDQSLVSTHMTTPTSNCIVIVNTARHTVVFVPFETFRRHQVMTDKLTTLDVNIPREDPVACA